MSNPPQEDPDEDHDHHRPEQGPIVLSSDERLGAAANSVDAGFQRFYREQYASTVRLARMLTGAPDHADDLAQEAFVRLYRQGDRAIRPAALLRTITVNLCRSWHTSERRATLRMVRHGPDPESLTSFERELDDSLRRLPYDQRAVIVLRYWLGMSEADIADSLDCRPGTVKSRHGQRRHSGDFRTFRTLEVVCR